MNYIRIISVVICISFMIDFGFLQAQSTTPEKKSVKSSKKKKIKKKRKKKTPRLILKKFSRDSLKVEKSFKKELLKLKKGQDSRT